MLMKFFTTLAALLLAGTLSVNAQSARVAKADGDANNITHIDLSADPVALAAPQSAPLKAKKHPVDEQPEGTLKTYAMNTVYYTREMGEEVHRYGQKTMLVFTDDGEVWIQNFINTFLYNTWIMGEISADRKKVVFENFQPYLEQGDYTYYVSVAYQAASGDYFADMDAESFSFDYDEATGELSNPSLAITLASEVGGANTMNIGYEFKPFTDELVQLPETIGESDIQPYSLKWETTIAYTMPGIAYVARDGDDFYFKGFSTKTPDAWVKGTLNETKDSVIISNGQYIGMYDGLYFLYIKGATYIGYDSDGWPIYRNKDYAALKWNESDKSFYGPDGILVVLGKELKGGYSQSIPSQDMKPFYGVAAKPQTPDIRYFNIDDIYGTESNMAFVVPVEDVNGNFINPDSLYYRIFLDGEQLHLDNSKGGYYQHFPDEWEVPCRFSDRGLVNNRTDNSNGTLTYHSFSIDKQLRPGIIGLQSVYYMNGTRTLSDICNFNTSTGKKTYTDGDPDPSILQGIANAATDPQPTEGLFDLQGRRLAAPATKGLYISNGRKFIVR